MIFLGEIAFAIELLLIALGLVGLYFSQRENSIFLKSASYVLIVGGIFLIFCTTIQYFPRSSRGMSHMGPGVFNQKYNSEGRRGGRRMFRKFYRENLMDEQEQAPSLEEPAPEDEEQ